MRAVSAYLHAHGSGESDDLLPYCVSLSHMLDVHFQHNSVCTVPDAAPTAAPTAAVGQRTSASASISRWAVAKVKPSQSEWFLYQKSVLSILQCLLSQLSRQVLVGSAVASAAAYSARGAKFGVNSRKAFGAACAARSSSPGETHSSPNPCAAISRSSSPWALALIA